MPLARVAGVTIRVHVTFFALVVLVALTAADAGETVVAAVGWLLALFACVVAHELAHAVVAQSKGIAVHEIDLLPIGGISRLERIPERWRDEAAIAAAGPIASAGIAAVAFALAAGAGEPLLSASPWDGPLLVRLAWANLLLAGFNLLPAFPLDGGRVFRALLERDHSRVEATRRAAYVSRLLAILMIAVGALFNLWLIVIGVFVLVAGRAEEAAVLIHAALGPATARTLAWACPIALPAEMAAGDAVRTADLHPQPAYPVTDAHGRIQGAVNLGVIRGAAPATPVRELASGTIVEADAPLEAAAVEIVNGPVVVTSGGAVVGVITRELLDDYLRQRLHDVVA
ncbi:MAG: site-2 protease family protein [Acidimicrobiales bacterium]